MLLELHREPLYRKYYASPCSYAFLFFLGLAFAVLIVPYFMAYGPYNFWLKRSIYYEQPQMDYTYQAMVLAEGVTTGGESFEAFFSTMSTVNSLFQATLRVPVIKSNEVDANNDGLVDRLMLNINMPLSADEQVYSVTAAIFFTVRLQDRAKVEMDSVAYFQRGTSLAGMALQVDGDYLLRQTSPLNVYGGFSYPYQDQPLLDVATTVSSGQALFSTILDAYSARNLSMTFDPRNVLWQRAQSFTGTHAFNLTATVRIDEQQIVYTPPVSEVLLDGWIKYLSMFVVVLYLADRLSSFLYYHQVVEVKVTQPLPSNLKAHYT